MTIVVLREGESNDSLLKRFSTGVLRDGVLRQIREKRYFQTKGESRRRRKAKALRRLRRKNIRTTV